MKKYFLIWVVIWIVIYAIVPRTGYPDAANGVLGPAAISLFFMLKILGGFWSGEVIEIKTEQKSYADDVGVSTRDIDYTYTKLVNAKIKKFRI